MAQTRIIIVDDDSLIRMDLRDLLQRMGYLVVGEAGDAQSGINTARSLRPDLVIMDVRMAGDKDGIDAAATLTKRGCIKRSRGCHSPREEVCHTQPPSRRVPQPEHAS